MGILGGAWTRESGDGHVRGRWIQFVVTFHKAQSLFIRVC